MSKKVLLAGAVVAVGCIGAVAISLSSQTKNSDEQEEIVAQGVPAVASSSQGVQSDLVEVEEKQETPAAHTEQKSAPLKSDAPLKVEEITENEEKDVELAAGERVATDAERTKIKASIAGFVGVLKTGSRDEVKLAMGYNDVTAEEKAEFDSMSDDEYESMLSFVTELMEDSLEAIDTPGSYNVIVTSESQERYDIVISSIPGKTGMSESYEFSFKDTGGKWLMVNQ